MTWYWIVAPIVGAIIIQIDKSNRQRANDRAQGPDVHADRKPGFNYLGGHPTFASPSTGTTLAFARNQLSIEAANGQLLFKLPMDSLVAIEVETEEEMRLRVTATRLLLTGIFAFAWKKRTAGSVMVTIETTNGPLLFERPNSSKPQVLGMLASQKALLIRRANLATTATESTAANKAAIEEAPEASSKQLEARFEQLRGLLDSGVITQEEHDAKRAEILHQL